MMKGYLYQTQTVLRGASYAENAGGGGYLRSGLLGCPNGKTTALGRLVERTDWER
jgi:hypothetical protein